MDSLNLNSESQSEMSECLFQLEPLVYLCMGSAVREIGGQVKNDSTAVKHITSSTIVGWLILIITLQVYTNI